jgi:hypothetical protein
VNAELGLDPATGKGESPDRIVMHSAGVNEDGHVVLTEVWDSREHQAAFMNDRLGPAMARGAITGRPSTVPWIEIVCDRQIAG